MTPNLNPKTIGLFGTCGGSTWRQPFLELFANRGIPCFNPQVDNWTPELAEVEAWHLANDPLLLFPVTGETYGFGSLAEAGFSVQAAMAPTAHRFVLVYIAPDVDEALKQESPEQAAASRRARALVLAHLKHTVHPGVFIASSMADMRDKALKLYAALEHLEEARAPAGPPG